MDAQHTARPVANVIETEVDGDVGLYDPSTEEVVVLNQTASDIWRLCDGGSTLDEIVRLLARAYGAEPSTIREDVAIVVDQLRRQGFLE